MSDNNKSIRKKKNIYIDADVYEEVVSVKGELEKIIKKNVSFSEALRHIISVYKRAITRVREM
jgi:predicted CopG family antitoxin